MNRESVEVCIKRSFPFWYWEVTMSWAYGFEDGMTFTKRRAARAARKMLTPPREQARESYTLTTEDLL